MQKKKKKFYRIISFLIKIGIVVFAFGFIYKQIFLKHDVNEIKRIYSEILQQPHFTVILIFSILLMPLNWGLEAMKWKLMISKLEKISLLKSFQAIFSGVTVSFFTPNRVGEFGGRIFYLEKADRIEAILVSILGSMCQLLITIIVGCVSILFFIPMQSEFHVGFFLFTFIVASVLLLLCLLLFFYFRPTFLKTVLGKVSFLKHYGSRYLQVFSLYSKNNLWSILGYSFGRYIVFTMQFYFLLRLMNVQIPLIGGVIMIAMTFLTMAIPTIGLFELGIRGAVAVYFIGQFSDNHIGILTASFSLWIINLAIPAILGAVFVFKLKFFKINE